MAFRCRRGPWSTAKASFHRPAAASYVLKPVNEGSSVGVAIVRDDSNYGNPIARDAVGPWQAFDRLLAEPFIKGRELTVAVLRDEALGVTELRVKSGFYDYDAKYTDGLTQHVCPADVPEEVARRMKDLALQAHRILGCKGRRARISAGTTNMAWRASICSRSTPSPA